MSVYEDENVEIVEETPIQVTLPAWLVVLLMIMVGGIGYLVYATQTHYTELTEELRDVNNQLAMLDARSSQLEDTSAAMQGKLDVTSSKLGLTQRDLRRARSLAEQNREQQRADAAKLENDLQATRTEVATVQGSVEETQQTVEETMSQLERTMGDLGIQSGLVASNKEELEALKQRGKRNYFDFELNKSKRYTRVGEISLRLNKSDQKRQKYTVTVLANDKKIEKKDKTLLEPVQFYQQGTRNLLEVVVFEISKNRVAGYLSAPKDGNTRTARN
jgi:chromosome segregation ATPase